jgi:hypothetical protein
MPEQKVYPTLKIGLLIVAIAYFLFTVHGTFTIEWIGEWDRIATPGSFLSMVILVEDVAGFVGFLFRLAASLAALIGVILYFQRKSLSAQTVNKILRVVFVGEAVYWLGLLPSGVLGFYLDASSQLPPLQLVPSILTNDTALLIQSIVIPVLLVKLAYESGPNKPAKKAIKWGLITGTVYILAFWLTNTGLWLLTIFSSGVDYLISYPENLLSLIVTAFGMFALTVYAAYFTKKSIGAETVEQLKRKPVGVIITGLGLFFFWNYLSWVFFGRDATWSLWYAWFLGHNLDLWMLALPLVGLPLLFERKASD